MLKWLNKILSDVHRELISKEKAKEIRNLPAKYRFPIITKKKNEIMVGTLHCVKISVNVEAGKRASFISAIL